MFAPFVFVLNEQSERLPFLGNDGNSSDANALGSGVLLQACAPRERDAGLTLSFVFLKYYTGSFFFKSIDHLIVKI